MDVGIDMILAAVAVVPLLPDKRWRMEMEMGNGQMELGPCTVWYRNVPHPVIPRLCHTVRPYRLTLAGRERVHADTWTLGAN